MSSKGRVWYWPNTKKYTLSATTEATDYDVENVLNPYVDNTWRSVGVGTQYVTFDGATGITNAMIYIGNHNLSAYTTFQVQSSNNNFSTFDSVDITDMYRTLRRMDSNNEPEEYTYRDGFVFISSSYQDHRIKIVSASVSYYEIGFIAILERSYTFDNNWTQRFPAGYETQKDLIQSPYGNTSSKHWFQRWTNALDWNDSLSTTQVGKIANELPMSPVAVFWPEYVEPFEDPGGGISPLRLVEAFTDGPPQNLQAESTDNKSFSIRMVEKI